jgi:hypothetical protein
MDPWLELRWRDVHARLIIYIADQLQDQLPNPLVARAEEDVFVDVEGETPERVRPDVSVAEEQPDEGGGGTATLAPPATVAKPLLIRVPEPEVDRWIQIIDPAAGDRVVTVIEVLSPSNKVAGPGRAAYLAKQSDFLAAGINLIEIDLVRKGQWAFSADEAILPSKERTTYMACVFRAARPEFRAFYRFPFREALPRIAIPLRPRDRDVVLDLQQVIDAAYEHGRYERTDYRRPLDPPLSPEESVWATELLEKAGRLR